MTEIGKSNSSQLNATTQKGSHSFQIRFFQNPILCLHCNDYIWGEGHLGFGCLNCAKCVHSKCALFIVKLSNCSKTDQLNLDSITRPNLYPIENWSVNVVKEWLAVVNLHRYAEVFATYNINGSKLLDLDIYQLHAFRIRDTFHHAAILQARDELKHKSRKFSTYQQMILEQEEAKSHLISNQYKAENHFFLVHSVSKLTDCQMCERPLLGILHQGLMCQKCGLITHRQCSSTGLPKCEENKSELKPKRHFIFGVSLFDLAGDNTDQMPLILEKCFKNIEERALINNEDLYDVYRLTADSTKIDLIKQQIDENGIDLTNFDSFDLNTIAALVKTFLRDLQDSVIPESVYEKLINKIQSCTSNELRSLINTDLHPLHLSCLKLIMGHLIRVWNYQHRVRGCHFLPDKLFHIFRSILLRPAWENITQIVYNIENQTLVIQRLILEYDCGVDLPEYKIRPKRPVNPSLSYSTEQEIATAKQINKTLKISSKSIGNIFQQFVSGQTKNNNNQDCINENQWYWGSINRDDTFLILKNCPDGSFLVRCATDKSFDAPYTLCVMKSSLVKSIKIFRQEQAMSGTFFYDIEKPCRFESVSALISYYSRVSLKEYNHNLDVVLTYGVSKYKFGKTTEWSMDKLYSSFRNAFQEYEQLTKKYDGLDSEIGNVREDLNQKKITSDAFDKIIQLYTNQVEQVDRVLNENLLKKTNAISTTRLLASQLMPSSLNGQTNPNSINDDEITRLDELMKENKEKLKKRIDELNEKKEQVKSDIDYLSTVVSQLQEELDFLRPELIEIRKKRENYHMWLVQRGENDDKIQTKLKHLSKSDLSESLEDNTSKLVSMENLTDVPGTNKNQSESVYETSTNKVEESVEYSEHQNSLNWYVPDFTREQAIETLKSKPNGTYLVRPNSKPNSKYILSLVASEEIKHILIDENQSGCFIKSNFNQRRLPANLNMEHDIDLSSRSPSVSSFCSTEKALSQSMSSSSLKSLGSSGSIAHTNDESNNSTCSKSQEIIKFKSLTDLIIYYSKNQIKTNNIVLDTVLMYPAYFNIRL